jgi:hypothetical protein
MYVAWLSTSRQAPAQSNARYLDALACADDPTPAIRELDAITRAVMAESAAPDDPNSTRRAGRGMIISQPIAR